MTDEITIADIRALIGQMKAANFSPSEIKMWVGVDTFSNISDEAFVSMYEDSRITLHMTKTTFDAMKKRYNAIKNKSK